MSQAVAGPSRLQLFALLGITGIKLSEYITYGFEHGDFHIYEFGGPVGHDCLVI
jgi:hypothetical protein